MDVRTLIGCLVLFVLLWNFIKRPSRKYCRGRLDQNEVNHGSDVTIVGQSMNKVLGFYVTNFPKQGDSIPQAQLDNRKCVGESGVITGFYNHGGIRVIKHRDGTEAAYHYHELSFSKKHYEDLGFNNVNPDYVA